MSEWKDTEIGRLPKSWEIKTIGLLIEDSGISVGVMYPGEHVNDGVPIIKAGDIKEGRIIHPISNKISEKVNVQYKRTILKGGEILVVLVGDSGTTAVVGKVEIGYNVARAIGVLKLKQPEEAKFISYCFSFRPVKAMLDSFCNTTVQRTLNLKELKDVIIPWPNIEVRNFISKTLYDLDSKISLLRQQNQTLEELAQTLFKQLLSEENLEREVSLDEIANIGIGRTPPRKEDQWFSKSENDVKWISIKDMGLCGVYINKTSEYLTNEAVSRFSIPVIPKNTVVLSFKMTLGRVAITTDTMLSNEAIAHFKIKDESLISTEYLYFFLRTYKYQNLGSTSSIVTSINSGMIKNIDIVIPKKEKMLQFTNSVKPLFNTMKSNSEQIDTITSLRDTLLPKLMSGEIKIN